MALLLLLLSVAACGDDTGEAGGARGAAAGPGSTARPPAEPACEHGVGGGRRFILCAAGDVTDQPLLVALHGRGSSAEELRAATRLDRVAAADGVATVFVEALDGGWGDDTFPTPARPAGNEDLVALDEVIRAARQDDRIGGAPVGVVGFSNGASMALRYASQRSDEVFAVVSVAGQLPRDVAIHPASRIPLLQIYGTADPIRPHETGVGTSPSRRPGDPTPTLSTADTISVFVDAAGSGAAADEPRESDPDPTDGTSLRTQRWADAQGTVAVLHLVIGGGHTWPSAHAPFTGGDTFGPGSGDLDASAAAVEFLIDPDAAGR